MNESRRRHGRVDKIESRSTVGELAAGAREQFLGKKGGSEKVARSEGTGRTAEEDKLRAAMGKRGGGSS